MLIIFAEFADCLGQLQSQLMEVSAFIEDLAENAISIICFEEAVASKKMIEVFNDALLN